MTAVQAIYDGRVFIPEKPCNITSGSKVTLTIEFAIGGISEKQKKLEAFRKLTYELTELNETAPLPPEFDEIVSQRLHFRDIPVL
jgi:predicted DNA-binding antitoxin AbrB/MazE fold protein